MAFLLGAGALAFLGSSYRETAANYWCKNKTLNTISQSLRQAAEDSFSYTDGKSFDPAQEKIEKIKILEAFQNKYHKGKDDIQNKVKLSVKDFNLAEKELKALPDKVSFSDLDKRTIDRKSSSIISWLDDKIDTKLFSPIRWWHQSVDSCWNWLGTFLEKG